MIGLGVLLAVILWFVTASAITYSVVRWIRAPALRAVIAVSLFALLLVAPIADELIGAFEYERLCRTAGQIKISGSMIVSAKYFSSDGSPKPEWARMSLKERERVSGLGNDIKSRQVNHGPMPIIESQGRLVDAKSGSVLAFYEFYSTRGGFISRDFEKPFFVADQCRPNVDLGPVYKQILKVNAD